MVAKKLKRLENFIFPIGEEETSEQKLIRKALLDVLTGKEAISIRAEDAGDGDKNV